MACTFSTSEPTKVVRTPSVCNILTSKCASRHNGVHFFNISTAKSVVQSWCVLYILTWTCGSRHNRVHFFDISTSKSGPRMVCFVHFDLEMCFAPQRGAFFRHRNFQKRSGPGVFCTFWLRHVLPATMACTFSTSEPTKVVRTPSVCNILTSKCASRHNGVHFFNISTAKSVVQSWCVLYILTWKCASRHNGVQRFHLSFSQIAPHPPL